MSWLIHRVNDEDTMISLKTKLMMLSFGIYICGITATAIAVKHVMTQPMTSDYFTAALVFIIGAWMTVHGIMTYIKASKMDLDTLKSGGVIELHGEPVSYKSKTGNIYIIAEDE